MDNLECMTTGKAARLLGVSLAMVRNMCDRGELEALRYGPAGWYRVTVESVERLRARVERRRRSA